MENDFIGLSQISAKFSILNSDSVQFSPRKYLDVVQEFPIKC